MIVTAGRFQAPLILKAKALGLQVLATDRDAEAASLALADHAVVADAGDFATLLGIARDFQPHAIVTEQTDAGVPGTAYVAEQLGLPGIGYDVALRATNKWLMREACRYANIPIPKYRLAKSVEGAVAAARDIGLPIVAKPTDNQSSRGVTKVMDRAALPAAIMAAFAMSRSGYILVEECMVGDEISIESFVVANSIHVLGISERVLSPPPYSFNVQITYPAALSKGILSEIEKINRRVIRAIGVSMGFTHVEMIITKQGVRLIEIAARGCGSRGATDLLPRLTGVDLLASRLRQSLGENIQMPQISNQFVGIQRFFTLPAGTVERITGVSEAATLPGVICIEFAPTIGSRIEPATNAEQRPGFVMAVAQSKDQALAIVEKAMHLVAVDVT